RRGRSYDRGMRRGRVRIGRGRRGGGRNRPSRRPAASVARVGVVAALVLALAAGARPALSASAVPVPAPADRPRAAGERIESLWVLAEVPAEGPARITEVID